MTTFNIIYRATVFASRSVDATEATVLTPVAGAAHSDQFKIATREGVTGFKPYMGLPSGRRGRMDLLSKKTDTGELAFDILDSRVTPGGSNFVRWVTAFIGNANGLPRFARLKCLIEESTDGGVTWAAFFTGRVRTLALKSASRVAYTMSVRDRADDLTYNVMTGLPHEVVRQSSIRAVTAATATTMSDSGQAWTTNEKAGASVTIYSGVGVGQTRQVSSNTGTQLTVSAAWTVTPDTTSKYYTGYAQLVSAMPVGIVRPYGAAKTVPELTGIVTNVDATNSWAFITLNPDQRNLPGNQYTTTLQAALDLGGFPIQVPPSSSPGTSSTIVPSFAGIAIARVTRTDTAAEGDFMVGYGYVTSDDPMYIGDDGVVFGGPTTMWALAIRPIVYPIGTASGAPLANGISAASATSTTQAVPTKGWTISITGIVKQGDLISWSGHGQRYLVQADANSDGAGLSTITVSPGLQSAIADNEVLTVQRSPGRMALPAVSTPVKLHVVCDMRLADGGQKEFDGTTTRASSKDFNGTYRPGNVLFINDVHPAQVLKDVMTGYFGRVYRPTFDLSGTTIPVPLPPGKNLGDATNVVPVQLTDNIGDGRHGFNALIADTTYPPFRCIVDKSMGIRDFVEEYICKPYGIGYYFDANGTFVPTDMRQPSTVPGGTPVITDTDLVSDKVPSWSYDPTAAVTRGSYNVYAETVLPFQAVLQQGALFPVITTKMFESQSGQIADGTLGDMNLSEKEYSVDFKGYRAMPGEQSGWLNNGVTSQMSRWTWVIQAAVKMAQACVARPFGNGPMTIGLTAVRNANTANIYPGGLYVVDIDSNPDPATNTRGPSRLAICTERAEEGPAVRITGIDLGYTTVANPPTLGTPAQLAGDIAHSATCAVTLNAEKESVEVWVNVTSTAVGVRPVDSDPNWMFVGWNFVNWVAIARGLPGGRRVWWRGRTNPRLTGHAFGGWGEKVAVVAAKIPSIWAYGLASVDLVAVSAPTTLTVDGITPSGFRVNWVNTDPARIIEIWMATPTSEARAFVAELPPGSTSWSTHYLAEVTTYRVGVRAVDGSGGFAEATVDATTTGGSSIIKPPHNVRGGRLLI